MSASIELLAPTLLMVALLAMVIVGLLIWVRTSRALQAERDAQRRVQTHLSLARQEAEGRNDSLKQGLSATSQACRQAVQQLALPDAAKSLALGLMSLLPKLPVPVDDSVPYRQTLRVNTLELERLEHLVVALNDPQVTEHWIRGSYRDLCAIPSLLLPEEPGPAQPLDNRDTLVALALAAAQEAAPAADDGKDFLHHPVQRPGWHEQ